MIQMQNNKPVCTENILHITSGEMTANALRELLPQEEILPFNEAMCEGEVHIEIFTDEFYRLRAAAYGVELEDYLQKSPGSFMQNRLKDYPVLYLYFDYDMFCTVNIITLLAFLEQSGYSGRIKFHLLEADGSVAILDTWPVLLGIYEKCYCRVLLKRQRFITGNELFDKGIELYLEYKKRNNRIIRYIKAHSMEEQKHLVQLKDDRAEACKKINEIEQEIAKTENELLEEENKFILLCGQKSQLMRERALQVGAEIEQAIKPQQPVDKLTILFLAANPQDTQKLALDQEVRSITEAIRKSEGRDGIEFFSRWAVQSLDILQAINETDPEIIHFSGHGSEKGEIVLDDGSGNMSMVSKEAMAAAVASASKKVRMIFFNACFSQKEAQAVVDKVEAAIGMNTEIGDEAAIVFAAQFYSSIGFGQNLQQAFDQAKAALLLKGIAEENTPVLYVRKGLLAQDIVMVESEALKKSDNVTIMQKIKKFFRDQRILR